MLDKYKQPFKITDILRNNKIYDGNNKKFGITIDSVDYIVKLPKKNNSLTILSEYISSEFITSLDINCQETFLGTYIESLVIVIKDFCNKNEHLRTYEEMVQSILDIKFLYDIRTYEGVMKLIDVYPKILTKNKQLCKEEFWKMIICDAILGNGGRHRNNWGFLETSEGYVPAPIYDNEFCLNFNKKLDKPSILLAPNSYIRKDINTRINYFNLFEDTSWNKILEDTYLKLTEDLTPKMVFNKIKNIVEPLEFLNNDLKTFYISLIYLRYSCIIKRIKFDTGLDNLKELLDSGINQA